jgi:molecular chaperone IbpA
MRTFDFDLSPLFHTAIGFDRIHQLLEAALSTDQSALSYPPYNIERTGDDAYRIVMAVAGFSEDDLDVTVKENQLVISGKLKEEGDQSRYLHRGIAGRAFERRFQLADYIRVEGARLVNGLLQIDLVREVPEALKPRKIKIETKAVEDKTAQTPTIEHKAA